jgi:hypothetical protein
MGCPPWRDDRSVISSYNCYWAFPAPSLSHSSPAELETVSYCRILVWGPFLSPLTNLRKYCNPSPYWVQLVSQSQSYSTTEAQSASLSRYQVTIWDPRPISASLPGKLYLDSLAIVIMRRLLWRKDVSVIYNSCWALPVQSFSGESRGTPDYILLSQFWDSPNLEGQVPIFIFPRNRVAQLYSQALSVCFVVCYDTQG